MAACHCQNNHCGDQKFEFHEMSQSLFANAHTYRDELCIGQADSTDQPNRGTFNETAEFTALDKPIIEASSVRQLRRLG